MIRFPGNSLSRKEFLTRTGCVVGAGIAGMTSLPAHSQTGKKAEYRILGRTGLKVSGVGYGTVLTDGADVLEKVIDMGINFIDTGRMYANGKNEEMIGNTIRDVRKNCILQTKFHRNLKNDRKAIGKSIDDSLKALKTDYIDIMLLHAASTKEEINSPEIFEALTRAKNDGKIRFTGFSSHTNQSMTLKAALTTDFYDVAMLAYNHAGNFRHSVYEEFYQEWDQDELEKDIQDAVDSGMGIVAMKTCSAAPPKDKGNAKINYLSGLKWVLSKKNISTMAVWMGSFEEAEEDVRAMFG